MRSLTFLMCCSLLPGSRRFLFFVCFVHYFWPLVVVVKDPGRTLVFNSRLHTDSRYLVRARARARERERDVERERERERERESACMWLWQIKRARGTEGNEKRRPVLCSLAAVFAGSIASFRKAIASGLQLRHKMTVISSIVLLGVNKYA